MKPASSCPAWYAGRRPFTGAWIETWDKGLVVIDKKSRPFTGAWIETIISRKVDIVRKSRPFTGAWIETKS